MKKKIFLLSVVFLFFLTSGCTNKQNSDDSDTQVNIAGNYLGSYYKENYVWGGAMNLAWNELNDNILQEKLKLDTTDKIALEMVEKLNNPVFTKNDLDEESYYVKSGYGQETVNVINRESKKKFPSKSFDDLQLKLDSKDIISYAYFLKEVEYETRFEKKDVLFKDQSVKGFYTKESNQRRNVKIVKYENDDKFIVSLQLKDNKDQLFLAKGYSMKDPQEVVAEINQNNKGNLIAIDKIDTFQAPKIHLDHHRYYVELINKFLANNNFQDYFIAQMFENIKFDMDEKGARVENEAVIGLGFNSAYNPAKPKPKNFILDKPYWVVMQRSDSVNPYFILGVNNTELMEKSN